MSDKVNISVESAEGLSRRIRIQVPAARIASDVEARLKSAAATISLKGYRPGKVPQNVMRQRFGDQARREVIQEAVQATLAEALARENFRPAAQPRIDLAPDAEVEGSDLSFTATFDILPDFELQGLRDIPVKRLQAVIDDADVEFVIEDLRRQRATTKPVSREARAGDRVTISFSGRIDGQPIPGSSGPPIPVVLGSGRMGPDIESKLIGFRQGEERTINATLAEFPAGPALAGRRADITVTVLEVAEQILPDVDEAFIRSFEVPTGSRDEFVKLVKEFMRDEFEARSTADVRRQLLDFLLDKNPISVPAELVDQEAARLQADAGAQAQPSGAPAASYRQTAERQVRLAMLTSALTRAHGISVDHSRVRARVDELASDSSKPDEVRNMYFQNPSLLAPIEAQVLDEQVVAWLAEKAVFTPVPTNFRLLKDR